MTKKERVALACEAGEEFASAERRRRRLMDVALADIEEAKTDGQKVMAVMEVGHRSAQADERFSLDMRAATLKLIRACTGRSLTDLRECAESGDMETLMAGVAVNQATGEVEFVAAESDESLDDLAERLEESVVGKGEAEIDGIGSFDDLPVVEPERVVIKGTRDFDGKSE